MHGQSVVRGGLNQFGPRPAPLSLDKVYSIPGSVPEYSSADCVITGLIELQWPIPVKQIQIMENKLKLMKTLPRKRKLSQNKFKSIKTNSR